MIRFATLGALYYWLVWAAYKVCASYLGIMYPGFMAGWYDANHSLIRLIPGYGFSIDNLVRDNFADGSIVFWELWFGFGFAVAVAKLVLYDPPRQSY